MGESGIHLAPVYDGDIRPHHLRDEHGEMDIFLLPFIKPVDVRRFFPDEADDIVSYTDALRVAVAHMDTDDAKRSVLVTHQFVTGAERSESEDISVGGTDNVDASVFDPFDYVGARSYPQTAEYRHAADKVLRDAAQILVFRSLA